MSDMLLSPPAGSRAAVRWTPRTRLLNALRGAPADRVPVWLMRQAGRYLPEYQAVRRGYDFLTLCKTPAAAAEVSIQPLAAIGSEAVIIFNDILLPLEQCGARVDFDECGPVIHNPIRAAADLAGLNTRPVDEDEPIARTLRMVRDRVGADVPVLGFIGAPWTLATYWIEGRAGKHFATAGALRHAEPGLVLELLERITPVAAEYLKIQVLAGADAVQIFDTWGGLLTPAEFARFSAPFIQRIITTLRADVRTADVPVIVYVNGVAPYLDQLAGVGADCISIDWRCDLAQARAALAAAQLARPLALQGNLDPLALLAGPAAVRRAVAELFARFPAGPGHVFNVGHGLLPQTPPAAAQALIEAVREHGRY